MSLSHDGGMTVEEGRFERTAPYLKLNQIEEMQEERNRLSNTLRAPPHLRNAIQDASTMIATLKRLEKSLERDTARPYEGAKLDAAVRREKELREKFMQGMPTAQEMRRQPPGAVEKYMKWEGANKRDIGEWKNIRRRLLASGAVPSEVSDTSIANIEMYRPTGTAGELPMDGAAIPQTRTYYGLGGRSTIFTEDELALLEKMAPKLRDAIATLSATERDEVKSALASGAAEPQFDKTGLDTLTAKEARDRCRAHGLATDGMRDELIDRLKAHLEKS